MESRTRRHIWCRWSKSDEAKSDLFLLRHKTKSLFAVCPIANCKILLNVTLETLGTSGQLFSTKIWKVSLSALTRSGVRSNRREKWKQQFRSYNTAFVYLLNFPRVFAARDSCEFCWWFPMLLSIERKNCKVKRKNGWKKQTQNQNT